MNWFVIRYTLSTSLRNPLTNANIRSAVLLLICATNKCSTKQFFFDCVAAPPYVKCDISSRTSEVPLQNKWYKENLNRVCQVTALNMIGLKLDHDCLIRCRRPGWGERAQYIPENIFYSAVVYLNLKAGIMSFLKYKPCNNTWEHATISWSRESLLYKERSSFI